LFDLCAKSNQQPPRSPCLFDKIEQLTGERRDEARRLVIMNAAAVLYLGGAARDLAEGAKMAADAIDSGGAQRKLGLLIEATSS
jgi:anthranilate phosphoribosyltransferase